MKLTTCTREEYRAAMTESLRAQGAPPEVVAQMLETFASERAWEAGGRIYNGLDLVTREELEADHAELQKRERGDR